jgi:hypothetical protein
MLVYPQLATGALSQYPVRKRRRVRTVMNTAGDGSTIKYADPGAGTTEWELEYDGLTDGELAVLMAFFEEAEGTLNGFTFLDPTGNLLAWSDELDHAAWQRDPLLAVQQVAAGTWRLTNSGGAPQSIGQTLAAPGGYLYCVSVYARAAQAGTAALVAGGMRSNAAIGPEWRRITLAANGQAGEESIRFALEVSAGATVDVRGFQVEPQAGASGYKASTTSGVYANAHFRDDTFAFATLDVNRHSATVNIIHAEHL